MDPIKFGHDLARKADLAHALSTQMFSWPDLSGQSLVFMGMGSSAFAAQSMVTRLQACGCDATFTLSSNPTPHRPAQIKLLLQFLLQVTLLKLMMHLIRPMVLSKRFGLQMLQSVEQILYLCKQEKNQVALLH